jgi:hypothetical protein
MTFAGSRKLKKSSAPHFYTGKYGPVLPVPEIGKA